MQTLSTDKQSICLRSGSRMRFQGMTESIGRCVITSCKPGPEYRIPVGSGPGYRTRRKDTRSTHRRHEFRPAIPQRVARQHCPSPLHRHHQLKSMVAGFATLVPSVQGIDHRWQIAKLELHPLQSSRYRIRVGRRLGRHPGYTAVARRNRTASIRHPVISLDGPIAVLPQIQQGFDPELRLRGVVFLQ
jgi:hypothetical protein